MFPFKLWSLCFGIPFLLDRTSAASDLSPQASWNQTGTTVFGLSNGTGGSSFFQLLSPYDMAISGADVLYISDTANNRIVVINLNDTNNVSFIGPGAGTNLSAPFGISITNTSLYVIDFGNDRVQKMTLDGSNRVRIPSIAHLNRPHYLFVDDNEHIYLSDTYNHAVVLFLPNATNGTVVAGDTTHGSNDSQLFFPNGIFVNSNGTMYIADHQNHRIMKWFLGASSGTRVAGSGTGGSAPNQLYFPMHVTVDTNGYMYISDGHNDRIVRWPPNSSFGQCIVACTGAAGVNPSQLNYPVSVAFDSKGSLYVIDSANNRTQKFAYQVPFYNQPKLNPCALWNSTAITFANNDTVGMEPYSLFIDTSNTIYIPAKSSDYLRIWSKGDTSPTRNISMNLNGSSSIFITNNGDIYVDKGWIDHQVNRWMVNATTSISAMYVPGTCHGFFVDSNNSFYCSLGDFHRVIRRSAYNEINQTTTVAGTGIANFGPTSLNSPRGIFIDTKFSLYVADCGNNRVQFFRAGSSSGTTVAGNGASNTITLDCPIGIAFDSDGYLFISDSQNNRVVSSSANGFRCVVGCEMTLGSASHQLNRPHMISFDSYGNLFVADTDNHRIQKFLLRNFTCEDLIPPPIFLTLTCPNTTSIGTNCNTSSSACAVFKPCQNNGTCNDSNTTSSGYSCSCPAGFNGTQCQFNNRLCQPNTCLNNGICNETSATTYRCICAAGWEGSSCETKIDLCGGITCQNNGICRSAYMNFTCECLGGSYSGRYCEIVSSKAKALQAVAKSFASIAIASLLGAATFIVVMDVLKYGFGMDFNDKKRKDIPKKKQRKPIKCCWQKKKTKKRRRPAPRHSVLSQKPVPKLVRPSVSVIIEGVM